MSKDTKLTMTDNDFYRFKEEVFNKLKENEKSFKESMTNFMSESEKKIYGCQAKCDEFALKLQDIQNTMNTHKVKVEKIPELDKFKTSASDQLFTQNVKLVNIQSELTNACNKYDKMYFENLVLPGTIGDYCKYKNLREYVEVRLISSLLYTYFIFFLRHSLL